MDMDFQIKPFESIAKTNTTHTRHYDVDDAFEFESIAKTNTTHTSTQYPNFAVCLRVLLKQIQHTPYPV